MPDMHKPDPATADGSGDCPVHPRTRTGSRSWFWMKRWDHSVLWLAPVLPLPGGIRQLFSPSLSVQVDDGKRAAMEQALSAQTGTKAEVTRVMFSPASASVMDRFLLAAPSLLLAVTLGIVSYGLWRVEINLSSTGRYTQKDLRCLTWASYAARVSIILQFALLVVISVRFGDDAYPGDQFGVMTLFVALMVGGVLMVMLRAYRNGAAAWRELQEGV